MAKFLDVECDKEFLKKVEDMCSFEKMKKDKDKIENKDEWKDGQPGMYRKGMTGLGMSSS